MGVIIPTSKIILKGTDGPDSRFLKVDIQDFPNLSVILFGVEDFPEENDVFKPCMEFPYQLRLSNLPKLKELSYYRDEFGGGFDISSVKMFTFHLENLPNLEHLIIGARGFVLIDHNNLFIRDDVLVRHLTVRLQNLGSIFFPLNQSNHPDIHRFTHFKISDKYFPHLEILTIHDYAIDPSIYPGSSDSKMIVIGELKDLSKLTRIEIRESRYKKLEDWSEVTEDGWENGEDVKEVKEEDILSLIGESCKIQKISGIDVEKVVVETIVSVKKSIKGWIPFTVRRAIGTFKMIETLEEYSRRVETEMTDI